MSTSNKNIEEKHKLRVREMNRSFDCQASMLNSCCGGKKPLIVDGGANRGQTTQRYLDRFPECEIHAFEPFPESYEYFANKYDTDQRVTAYQVAIGDSNGMTSLYLNQHHGTHSVYKRPSTGKRYYPSNAEAYGEIQVKTTRLDDWINRTLGLDKAIDLLKLDIQGGERGALRGAQMLLTSGKIRLVYCEVFFVTHYESAPFFHHIAEDLDQHGYTLYDLFNLERANNGQLRFADALFIHDSVRRMVVDQTDEEP